MFVFLYIFLAQPLSLCLMCYLVLSFVRSVFISFFRFCCSLVIYFLRSVCMYFFRPLCSSVVLSLFLYVVISLVR